MLKWLMMHWLILLCTSPIWVTQFAKSDIAEWKWGTKCPMRPQTNYSASTNRRVGAHTLFKEKHRRKAAAFWPSLRATATDTAIGMQAPCSGETVSTPVAYWPCRGWRRHCASQKYLPGTRAALQTVPHRSSPLPVSQSTRHTTPPMQQHRHPL